MSLLELDGVDLAYDSQPVLSGFSLTVGINEKVLLAGDSGTGKSSVLALMLGFARPSSGSVRFGGEHLDSHLVWQLRREVAYVPQVVDLGDGTGMELLEWIAALKSNRGRVVPRDQLMQYARTLRLGYGVLGKRLPDLSGGERQRVALLAALSLNRSIYLLDEPTASLDGALKETVVDFFSGQSDWTVLVVSHDPVWKESGAFRAIDLDSLAPGGSA